VQRNIPIGDTIMFTNIFKGLARYYADWRRRHRAAEELYALDERSLADLGITRSEIPYVLARVPEERDPRPAQRPARTFRHAA
jgi:uncharacterized protein YjiS (DUF1127 family)